jgi:hypothetical protein
MRTLNLTSLLLLLPADVLAQACPLFFGENSPNTPPVVVPTPLFSGVGSSVCLGMPPCVYRDDSDPAPTVSVNGNQVNIDVPLRYRGFMTPDDCGSNTYFRANLPGLAQGTYNVDYILRYTQVVAGPVTFERSGTITVGGTPSPIPALTFPSIIALLAGVGLIGIKRGKIG